MQFSIADVASEGAIHSKLFWICKSLAKNTNEPGPAWQTVAGNHRIRGQKQIAFSYSDPGVVCYTAVFSVVTQYSSLLNSVGNALRSHTLGACLQRETTPAAKSEEKRLFSQAKEEFDRVST